METGPGRTLTAFTLAVFGLTLIGVLAQEPFDAVLRVEGWSAEIRAAASEAGLPDPCLLAGLVYAESRGKAEARSEVGAIGLCQLMPGTAAELAARLEVSDPTKPRANLRLGARYLADRIAASGGDVDLGLLAYRLGPARAEREAAAAGSAAQWVAELRRRQPSPWEYVLQVRRFRDRFHERGRLEG